MSLEQTSKPETETSKKSKKNRAEELALRYKELPYAEARRNIMEEIPCSRATATKALIWVAKEQTKEKAVKPSMEVVEEAEKKPEFLKKEEEKPIEEIKPEKPIQELKPEEVEEQLNVFRDMLRGMHALLLSKDGILGEKYGRPEAQCVQASDQLYRWLTRRYGVEDLERYDTILLMLSYGTLVGGIVKEVVVERRKQPSASKKE